MITAPDNRVRIFRPYPRQIRYFFTNLPWEYGRTVVAEDGDLCEARFKLHDGVTFVRAEIMGSDGRVGYAQIIEV